MASLKKRSHGIPPSTSSVLLAILFDLFLRNPLVVCYVFDPDILAGLSLVVGYQVVANG